VRFQGEGGGERVPQSPRFAYNRCGSLPVQPLIILDKRGGHSQYSKIRQFVEDPNIKAHQFVIIQITGYQNAGNQPSHAMPLIAHRTACKPLRASPSKTRLSLSLCY
jgi:hypothetical protein